MTVLLAELKDKSVIPSSRIVDLHALLEGNHIKLSKSGMPIVLLQVSGTVLVKIEVLAVTSIMHKRMSGHMVLTLSLRVPAHLFLSIYFVLAGNNFCSGQPNSILCN